MLSNKRFELTKSTLALDAVVRQGWISIPAGEILRIIHGPHGEGEQLVDVLWDGRMLTMFAIDIMAGAREIESQDVITLSEPDAHRANSPR